jgi:uncharacterized membrane protein SpoIIM required for sporulation
VIIDLPRFAANERPYWEELDRILNALDTDPERRVPLEEVERLHYLYERCSASLARLDSFSAEPQLRAFLESLVSRAYSRIHETRAPFRIEWKKWILAFPRAFRRHLQAFALSCGITVLGIAFGVFAIRSDPHSKTVLMPFPHLMVSPAERVRQEENALRDRYSGVKGTFSAYLMQNNIQVAIKALAFGITWGVGTVILLFYNGVMLGAVIADYVMGGQTAFLAGWLLPHGSIEIPAILLGGQAGFILAGALIGWGSRITRAERFRAIAPDLLAIVAGAAGLLVWAGLIESFVSQYHQPVLPYSLKIAFGACETIALAAFLALAGRGTE